MAFKTDTIKLKLLTSDAQTEGVNGELAVVNGVLRLRTGNSWTNVAGPSVSQLSDLSDVDDLSLASENEVAYIYDAGSGNFKIGFQKLTVDNLSSTNFLSVSDLSDTNTPSSLTVTEENKVLGVVSYPSAPSSLSFDFSGLPDPIVVVNTDEVINFTIEGQEFAIYLNPDLGGNTSGTQFALNGDVMYVDLLVGGISPTTLQSDIYTVLDNYFSPDGWIISQGANTLTLSAPNIDSLYDISFLSGPNTLAVTTSTVDATNGGYQYELVDPTHADVLVDGEFVSAGLMTTDGAGNYTITTNNSANWNIAYGWGDHQIQGYVKNFTDVQSNLSADIIISAAQRNQKHIAMGDPSGFKYILPVAASLMNDNTIIEIINHSSYDQIISTLTLYPLYLTNTQSQSTADITIGVGQRALIIPKPANNVFFVSILTA